MNELLTERYRKKIKGVLHCFDRLVLFGSFQSICHPGAMEGHLWLKHIGFIEYQKTYANKLRLEMVEHMKALAEKKGIEIQFVHQNIRKEDYVAKELDRRGHHEGIVCILSAMESCRCYKVGKNKQSGHLCLRWSPGKCLHYYVYFIDAEYGLCYLRIPTWAPFRLQFYLNGHNWLEKRMKEEGIRFQKADNTFTHISDFKRANELAANLDPEKLHHRLDRIAGEFVGVFERFAGEGKGGLQWSIYQAEWATDIVFKNDRVLPDLYEQIVRTAVCDIKCPDVYRFLGKRLTKRSKDLPESRLSILVQGTRIKHTLRSTSIKMYDKQDRVLRIETTTSDVSSFNCRRSVASRDGTRDIRWASVRKSLYSLGVVREILGACNRRYLENISGMVDRTEERHDLRKVVESQRDEKDRSWRGVNFFREEDLVFLAAVMRGEHCIHGLRNRSLQPYLPEWSPTKIGRTLRRFRVLGLLKKVLHTTKYYLTRKGKAILTAGLQLKERIVIPALSTT